MDFAIANVGTIQLKKNWQQCLLDYLSPLYKDVLGRSLYPSDLDVPKSFEGWGDRMAVTGEKWLKTICIVFKRGMKLRPRMIPFTVVAGIPGKGLKHSESLKRREFEAWLKREEEGRLVMQKSRAMRQQFNDERNTVIADIATQLEITKVLLEKAIASNSLDEEKLGICDLLALATKRQAIASSNHDQFMFEIAGTVWSDLRTLIDPRDGDPEIIGAEHFNEAAIRQELLTACSGGSEYLNWVDSRTDEWRPAQGKYRQRYETLTKAWMVFCTPEFGADIMDELRSRFATLKSNHLNRGFGS